MSAALKPEAATPLMRLRDVHVTFQTRDRTVHAVNGVDMDLAQGEVLCILGESGSGKSVTLRALMRLLPKFAKVSGSVEVAGRDVMAMSERELSRYRGGDVSMIFQEPMTAMDPVFTIGRQIAEAVQRHEGVSRSAADARALELLELVQIPSAKRRLAAYPHELSGGLRQRAMIAVALACKPKLLLADEPTTALDATVQIQVLLLLRELQQKLGMGVIFVTHDLGVAGEIADRVAVMYAGKVVEEGPVAGFMSGPAHPYPRGLLNSTVHGNMRGKKLTTIPGAPPSLATKPMNCSFAPRCALAEQACLDAIPPMVELGGDRRGRCIKLG
ncbi:ABC transporter ATP-binding protein [Rhodovarius crocodyli]|uniref:ABC transporter ATP-binding protein n=1 Tax=Rhodovarius crocodyli TaxID=1979269 RepID=A0A437MDA8_9PROT|nr:ABC transporter ATP-binding protein [Rhodovarius crocodyli]RVT95637.1 ABC transporter ATP-binding protein [Rhodovarius crocodyli]